MKTIRQYITLIFIVLTISSVAQNTLPGFYLQTDRYCYVSGDIAYFKVYSLYQNFGSIPEQTLYIDLVTPNERFISGDLVSLNNGVASGYFNIPDSLVSGEYQLRVYLKDNENEVPDQYSGKTIYVTNRFGRNEPVYSMVDIEKKDTTEMDDSTNFNLNGSLSIVQNELTTRHKVTASIQLETAEKANRVTLSAVVKPLSRCEYNQEKKAQKLYQLMGDKKLKPLNKELLKGNSGVLIKGKLVNLNPDTKLDKAIVLLTFQDTLLHIKYDLTNELGEFCLYLNDFYNEQTGFFTAYNFSDLLPLKDIDIILDPVFYNDSTPIKAQPEPLTYLPCKDSLNIIKSIVAKAYQQNLIEPTKQPLLDTISYENKYLTGPLTDMVYPDDFINLPNFVEVAKEILPFVRFKKEKDGYKFSLVDGESKMLRANPIVFVDGIPLVENELLVDLNSAYIKRVDVRSKPRFYGDVFIQNGIVLIWTKELNFWTFHQSKLTKAFDLKLFQQPMQFNFPDYSKKSDYSIPDFRQTIYWNPDLTITNKTAEFSFFTSDEKGKYLIEIEGISDLGEPVYIKKIITVE